MIFFAFIFLSLAGTVQTTTEQTATDIGALSSRMNTIETKLEQLTSLVIRLGQYMNRTIPDPRSNEVYFTAVLNDHVRGLVKGETIIYDRDFSNAGGGYDPSTGIFTAPTSGVYLFSVYCNSMKKGWVNLEMMQNGLVKGNCLVEPSYDGEDEIGGVMYTTRLNVGDRIWMEVRYPTTGTIDLKATLNSFLGVLIHQ